MSRTEFAALLYKYQTGTASAEERQLVEQWYALLEEEPRSLSDHEWKALENRLWAILQRRALNKAMPREGRRVPLWQQNTFRLGIAAAVCLLGFFGYVTYELTFKQAEKAMSLEANPKPENGIKVIRNTTAGDMRIDLEDGSRVLLKSKGVVSFPEPLAASERVVTLSGEAFFEVSENPGRPFLVNTGEITTKVLGTSFLIKAIPDNPRVEVAVRTGKVSVYESTQEKTIPLNKKGSGVVLGPNHQVVFTKGEKLFLTSLVDDPAPLPSRVSEVDPSFDFDDVPLHEVLNQLKKAYNIDIETDRKALSECPLTARLSGKGLYVQLEIICATIQGTYEIKGTTILISGKGCESGL